MVILDRKQAAAIASKRLQWDSTIWEVEEHSGDKPAKEGRSERPIRVARGPTLGPWANGVVQQRVQNHPQKSCLEVGLYRVYRYRRGDVHVGVLERLRTPLQESLGGIDRAACIKRGESSCKRVHAAAFAAAAW